MYDVITIGSATVDAFVDTENKLFKGKQGHVTVPFGSKILVDNLNFQVGGGGTNTAAGFSRLGLKTAYIGKIGLGTNSTRVMDTLKKEKISTGFVVRSKDRTGYSVILDAKCRDRVILVFKGGNDKLDFKEIDVKKLKTRWVYSSSMINKSFHAIEKLAFYCKKNEIGFMFNPSNYQAKKGKYFLRFILKNTVVLCLNREEASLIVGEKDVEEQLEQLRALGPKVVIITEGKKNVHCISGDTIYTVYPHGVKGIENTGAGDAFGCGFLSGLMKKDSIEFGLQMGVANAESVIQNYGAKTGLLSWDKALLAAQKNPCKIKKIDI